MLSNNILLFLCYSYLLFIRLSNTSSTFSLSAFYSFCFFKIRTSCPVHQFFRSSIFLQHLVHALLFGWCHCFFFSIRCEWIIFLQCLFLLTIIRYIFIGTHYPIFSISSISIVLCLGPLMFMTEWFIASVSWRDRPSLSYHSIHKIGGILSHLSYEVVKYSKDIHRAFPISYPVDRTGNNISLSSFIKVEKKFSK